MDFDVDYVGQVHNCQPMFSVLPFHADAMMKLKQSVLCSRTLFTLQSILGMINCLCSIDGYAL